MINFTHKTLSQERADLLLSEFGSSIEYNYVDIDIKPEIQEYFKTCKMSQDQLNRFVAYHQFVGYGGRHWKELAKTWINTYRQHRK